jgi:hypothetical protein
VQNGGCGGCCGPFANSSAPGQEVDVLFLEGVENIHHIHQNCHKSLLTHHLTVVDVDGG